MKKITSLLMLFLAFVGTAWAQVGTPVTDLANLSNDKVYTLQAKRGFLGIKDAKAIYGYTGTVDATKSDNLFAILHANGKYYLFNVGQQKFVSSTEVATSTGNSSVSITELPQCDFKVNPTNDKTYPWYFTVPSKNNWFLNMRSNHSTTVDSWNTLDDGNKYNIVENGALDVAIKEAALAKLNSNIEVTYNYKFENKVVKTTKVQQLAGSEVTPPAIDYVTFEYAKGKVSATNNSIEVTCTEALPFEKTTDLNNAKWHAVDLKHTANIWEYVADGQDTKVVQKSYDCAGLSQMTDSHMWCFVGNVFDGFQIYNKAAGTTNTLNKVGVKAQVTADANHTKWFIEKGDVSGTFITNENKNNNKQYINLQGGVLHEWWQKDQGSSCTFHTPGSLCLNTAKDVKNIPANAVGGFLNNETIDCSKVEANPFSLQEAQALATAITNLKSNGVELVPGGYYRIYSAFPAFKEQQGKHKTFLLNNEATYVHWGDFSASNVGAIFQIETSTAANMFYLKNCNTNKYMQGPKGLLDAAKKDVTLTQLGNAQYNIKFGNSACHAEWHGNGSGQGSTLTAWGGLSNTASAWYIVKATDLEVALTQVGTEYYSTAYLPFAVSEVAGATAYTGQQTGQVLHMTSVTSIPAQTGVVLKGTANKATLTIGDAAATVANNALSGTLLGKDWANELVLGNHAQSGLGFYSMTAGKKIGANKAFIPAAQAAQGLVLSFDGEATGIESVMGTANTNAPIFDLSGRRVMKTVKGGLYIQNGKKFIVR